MRFSRWKRVHRFGPEPESKEEEEEEEGTPDEYKIQRQDFRHMEFMEVIRADGVDPRLLIPPAPSVKRADPDNVRITIVPGMVRIAAERLEMSMSRYFGLHMGDGGWITSEGQDKNAEVRAAKALYTRGIFSKQVRQEGGKGAGSESDTGGNDDESYHPFPSDDDESMEDLHCIGDCIDDSARDDGRGGGDVAIEENGGAPGPAVPAVFYTEREA